MNELPRETRLTMLRCFVRGCGVLDTADIVDCDPGTVLRYLGHFGIALAAAHDRLVRGIESNRIEADEVWSFVYGKSRNRRDFAASAPGWAGDYFTWSALDPDTKLLISWHVSKRKLREALKFLFDVRSRVVGKVLITTDALPLYRRAVSIVFGADADHVVIEKVLQSRWNRETGDRQVVVVSMKKVPQKGAKVDLDKASTSHNERHNGSFRNFISRLCRYTYGYSKKLEHHRWAHDIYGFWYNFRKEHRSLGHETPAMRANITDKIWSWDDILDEVERYWAKQAGNEIAEPREFNGEPLIAIKRGEARPDSDFFVCFDTSGYTAKVHAGHCNNCKWGRGRGGSGLRNLWFDFHDRASAEAAAAILAPEDHSVCSMCIKRQYRTRFQPV